MRKNCRISTPCEAVIGEVTGPAAARTGLKPGTPVVAGTVDCNAAYVANGAIHDGDISIAMGTAGCMGYLHREPRFSKNMISWSIPQIPDTCMSPWGPRCPAVP